MRPRSNAPVTPPNLRPTPRVGSARRARFNALGAATALAAVQSLSMGTMLAAETGLQAATPQGITPLVDSTSQVYSDLYVLGPGDALTLTFLDPSATSVGGPVAILPDGTATLALLGSVQLTGLTIGQATRWLTSLYSKQLIRPQLFLTLTTPRPVKVSVIGEVEKPGLYPLPSLATPVLAIQAAGGITLHSDIRRVLLRRRAGADGSQKQTVLDLAQLFQFGNQRQNPILFDGDTLIVGRTEEVIPQEVLQLGATNLAPAAINVTVIGEVKAPGTLSLPANTPLLEAIFRAGGPVQWRANRRNIELVRLNRNGTTTREVFNYRDKQNISKGLNPPLRNGDTIIVNRSFYGETIDLLNQVVVPIGTVGTFLNYGNWWNWNR